METSREGLRGTKLRDHLRDAILGGAGSFGRMVVLVVDLDRLKDVNTVYGYAIGDRLLESVTDRLRRHAAFAVRMSGDRFVVVEPAEGENPESRVERLLRRSTEPLPLNGHRLVPQASAGFALFPEDGTELEQLLRRAELALDLAKRQGGGRLLRFDPVMEASLAHRKRLEGELETALRRNEFELHYQPQFGLRDGRVVGAEALLRWPRRPGGPISPAIFVPVAEQSGLIRAIGAWIVREAARTARRWYELGVPTPVSVNVSVAQLRRQDVARVVTDALAENDLPPQLFEIEVTESLFVDPAQAAIAGNLTRLARLGVGLAIDDFGTGYSSLAYLKRLPAQRIKVDRTFVDGVARDSTDEALMGTIVGLGRLFGKRVLAEGVETAEQRAVLVREGCHEAQGFLLARPMTEEDCTAFLLHHADKPRPAPRDRRDAPGEAASV